MQHASVHDVQKCAHRGSWAQWLTVWAESDTGVHAWKYIPICPQQCIEVMHFSLALLWFGMRFNRASFHALALIGAFRLNILARI